MDYLNLELGQILKPLHSKVRGIVVIVRNTQVNFCYGLWVVAHIASCYLSARLIGKGMYTTFEYSWQIDQCS